mmetsp:Transcript_10441/g.29857  ORF Transcript_10441/g.29857 Transcript_10441/m.29857 type:complete len:256 (-) Transcript_10441:132-899(-)
MHSLTKGKGRLSATLSQVIIHAIDTEAGSEVVHRKQRLRLTLRRRSTSPRRQNPSLGQHRKKGWQHQRGLVRAREQSDLSWRAGPWWGIGQALQRRQQKQTSDQGPPSAPRISSKRRTKPGRLPNEPRAKAIWASEPPVSCDQADAAFRASFALPSPRSRSATQNRRTPRLSTPRPRAPFPKLVAAQPAPGPGQCMADGPLLRSPQHARTVLRCSCAGSEGEGAEGDLLSPEPRPQDFVRKIGVGGSAVAFLSCF